MNRARAEWPRGKGQNTEITLKLWIHKGRREMDWNLGMMKERLVLRDKSEVIIQAKWTSKRNFRQSQYKSWLNIVGFRLLQNLKI